MAYKDEDDDIECEIVKTFGIFSPGFKGWNKEVNLVSWNGRPAKLDIRSWQKDHKKCNKGITLTREEAEELARLLYRILDEIPGKTSNEKPKGNTAGRKQPGAAKTGAKKRPIPPRNLAPFYDELELRFGALPAECKSARNTLLKKYHPDTYSGSLVFATKKTIKIKEAYDKIIAWWAGGEN